MVFKFLFPFEKVKKGSRIILYGAGAVGQEFAEQCMKTKYCDIICWIDKRWYELESSNCSINVSDIQEIQKYSKECDCVVIAINDQDVKEQIERFLLQHVTADKIVWRKPDFAKEFKENKRRIDDARISNIIPQYDKIKELSGKSESILPPPLSRTQNSKKIKVRFIAGRTYWWKVIEPVAREFLKDEGCDVLVISHGWRISIKSYNEIVQSGFEVVRDAEYDAKRDAPDILFATEEVPGKLTLIRDFAKLVVCIHGSIIKWEGDYDINSFIGSIYKHLGTVAPDYYIFDKLIYNEMQRAGLVTDKTVLIGNPKFDNIYEWMHEEKVYPATWKKLKNKKVILWTTDHHCFGNNVTFDIFAKYIFNYFANNEDLGLIFRPHPLYIEEMLRYKVWTSEDVEILRTYINQSNNIVWDDRGSYDYSYRICNAIMADSDCGIICSSLPLDVPVAALIRPGKEKFTQPELVEHLYKIECENEIEHFFKMVLNGIDEKREERQKAFHDNIMYYDGKIGKRVKDFVLEKYTEHIEEGNN